MIDLVITHLTHPWGPPWTLETLGDPWRPLATLGDMPENGHFGHFKNPPFPKFCGQWHRKASLVGGPNRHWKVALSIY